MQEVSHYQRMVIEFRDAIRKTIELKRTAREVPEAMPTLRFRRFDEIPPEDQEHVTFLRARTRGQHEITGIFGAQAHWPAYMASNHKQALASYQFQGVLPQLAKEAMHVAVSMTNGCDF